MGPSPFVKWGLPLVLFCVVGYAGLSRFVESTVAAKDKRVKQRSLRSWELEQAHKAIIGKINLDSEVDLKPIPRPSSDD